MPESETLNSLENAFKNGDFDGQPCFALPKLLNPSKRVENSAINLINVMAKRVNLKLELLNSSPYYRLIDNNDGSTKYIPWIVAVIVKQEFSFLNNILIDLSHDFSREFLRAFIVDLFENRKMLTHVTDMLNTYESKKLSDDTLNNIKKTLRYWRPFDLKFTPSNLAHSYFTPGK